MIPSRMNLDINYLGVFALVFLLILACLGLYSLFKSILNSKIKFKKIDFLNHYEKELMKSFKIYFPTYSLIPKVNLESFLIPDNDNKTYLDKRVYQLSKEKISNKHIDFLLLDEKMDILIGIKYTNEDIKNIELRNFPTPVLCIKKGIIPEKKTIDQFLYKISNKETQKSQ